MSMTVAERAAAVKLILDRQKNDKLAYVRLYDRQLDFVRMSASLNEIAFRAGNQQGKTLTGATMMAVFLTGRYPSWWCGRVWDRPVTAWVCGESTSALIQGAQNKLLGGIGESLIGSGMIPRDAIVKSQPGHGAAGSYDFIVVKHQSGGESMLYFKNYEQERTKWQGASLDVIWCDEEPPIEHYQEALARLIATNGLIYSTFTPLNGSLRVLPRFQAPGFETQRGLVSMAFKEALHLQGDEAQARILAMFPKAQQRARIHGLPLMGSSMVFEGIELESILKPVTWKPGPAGGLYFNGAEIDHRGWVFMWAMDFGIGHPFAAVLLGWNRDFDEIYVLAEVRMADAMPKAHAERMKTIAPGAPVAWPHDGTNREKGSGDTLITYYRKEGLMVLPTHAQFKDGGYSTEAGIVDMTQRMTGEKFFVSDQCRLWHEEFQNYHRKDGLIVKVNDDLMSATRIGCMQIRSARGMVQPPKPGGAGQPQTIPTIRDYNIFDPDER